ncbi:MAG: TIGR00304 family protein [Candidatus Aenigmatarchaeota archaeon]
MQEQLVFIGILLIFVGMLIVFLGAILGLKETRVDWGVFGLIGPIPFGAWNSKKAFILSITIFIVSMIILILIKRW